MQEEWRDVKGYEGVYQVSNIGIVRSLDRKLIHNIHNKTYIRRGYILSINQRNKKQEYMSIRLKNKDNRKSHYIHRLVAEAFIPNIKNKKQVNHIDGNPKNNKVDNLEWVTSSENVIHSFKIGKSKKNYGNNHHNSKNIKQYTKNGEFIKKWDSIMDAQRELGISQGNISSCCRQERKSAGGYKWRYITNTLRLP